MGKFIYTNAKSQACTFANTRLTQFNITFSKGNQYAILQCKRSKTDINYTDVKIIFATTKDKTFLVTTLHTLFIRDS